MTRASSRRPTGRPPRGVAGADSRLAGSLALFVAMGVAVTAPAGPAPPEPTRDALALTDQAAASLPGPDAAQPRSVVVPGLDAGVDGVDAGEVLLGELNCLGCHRPTPGTEARFGARPAPLLGEVARRARAGFLQAWLRDPIATTPGTAMPDLLHDLPAGEKERVVDDLVHFLESMARTPQTAPLALNRVAFEQGRVLYHRAGCVACHAPREPAVALFPNSSGPSDTNTVRFVMAALGKTSVPLGDLRFKYPPAALADLLLAPLQTHPAGRMPSLNLTTNEARAIATYLIESQPGGSTNAGDETPFRVDPTRARRGQKAFQTLGCAACHELGGGSPKTQSTLAARPLSGLNALGPGGCLDPHPSPRVPRFHLEDAQREAMKATLGRLAGLSGPRSPAREVAHVLVRFNCYGCHSRDGFGGPSPSRADYFTTVTDVDLGDEGRIPPHLSGVGGKLRPEWLGQVLTNRGTVRPYMAVRMPQFGTANVGGLTALLVRADVPPAGQEPPNAAADLEAGRQLVGAGGLACVSCHHFGPFKSTGIDVMDMTRMAKRLQKAWFRRYLLDPASLRPGTRMPMFWPEGTAALNTILQGNTERQIESIWRYLSQGTNAPPPQMQPLAAPAPKVKTTRVSAPPPAN